MKPKSKLPIRGVHCPKSVLRNAALALAFALGSFGFSLPVSASNDALEITPDSIDVRPANRRAELRKAIESNYQHDKAQDRRKLSQEEREALHRDLRAIMRNVNADYDDGRK